MAACPAIGNIEENCGGGNAAGVRTRLDFALVSHVESIAAATDHVISGNITLKADIGDASPGVANYLIASAVGGSYTAEPQGEAEDGDYLHTLTLVVPKMTPAKQKVMNAASGKQVVASFTDRNDYTWLIGNLKEGATMAIRPASNDRNGYTITLTWRAGQLLYNFTGSFAAAA